MEKLSTLKSPKRVDTLLAMVVFFVLLIVVMFSYLLKVNDIIYEGEHYNNALSKLPLYNETFNSFFLKSSTFNNYDEINANIKSFEDILLLIGSQSAKAKHGKAYEKLFNNLKEDFELKRNSIERFKSQNASLVNSIYYLVALNNSIISKRLLAIKDIEALNDTLLQIMKFYISPILDQDKIFKNLDYFTQLNKDKNLGELSMFIAHARLNTQRIKELSQIKTHSFNLYDSINKINTFTKKEYSEALFNSRIVVTVLFIVAFFILVVILLLFRRANKIKDELIGFKTAVENSYNSIVITDKHSNIVYVNDRSVSETGYSREELLGENPKILKSGKQSEAFYKKLHQRLDSGEKWEGEFVNKRKDGSEFYEKASIIPIFEGNKLVNYLAIKLNITDYIMQRKKVEHMAYHDNLTSLPNRTNIEEYLHKNLPIAKRNNRTLAILFIDIDNFKTINDTLGHDVGDEFIKECAFLLKSSIRESDLLARIGGDEFVIILESLNSDYSSAKVCTNIINKFKKPIKTKHNTLSITVSIGISIFPNDADNYITLFKNADMAMYEAKDKGKNNFQYYKKELSEGIHERLKIEQALKTALSKDEIFLVYQPKYKIKTQEVIGFETLVRWINKELGFIGPDKFIPIAEDTNDILEIGLYIFEKACIDFLELKKYRDSIASISINISTVQLYQDTFVDDILKIVDKLKIDPKLIMLEITETHIMKNIFHSMDVLNKLKSLGFKLSIDDFGTGYSSLNYLKQFPIDELKIDKSFVDELPHDQNDVAISKAIISLSKNMNYKNVAEGIETKEQENFLEESGCEIGQGYLFCKPLIKEDMIKYLRG